MQLQFEIFIPNLFILKSDMELHCNIKKLRFGMPIILEQTQQTCSLRYSIIRVLCFYMLLFVIMHEKSFVIPMLSAKSLTCSCNGGIFCGVGLVAGGMGGKTSPVEVGEQNIVTIYLGVQRQIKTRMT